MKTLYYYTTRLAMGYLVADMFGAMWWILSGQMPNLEGYYLGKLTFYIISLLIK
jgi:hypothetical protein